MKYIIFFPIIILLAGVLHAQNKNSTTLVGFQTGIVTPISFSTLSSKNIKIGIPTFSYAASLEKRFSLHTKLNFSFQYSLNYFRMNQENRIRTDYYLKNSTNHFSTNINFNSLYDLNKRTAVYAGVGLSKSVSAYFSEKNSSSLKTKTFGMSDVNPSLILGIENSSRMFNKNLYYSLQYNMGFFPLSQTLRTESNENINPSRMQGFYLGLKYKY